MAIRRSVLRLVVVLQIFLLVTSLVAPVAALAEEPSADPSPSPTPSAESSAEPTPDATPEATPSEETSAEPTPDATPEAPAPTHEPSPEPTPAAPVAAPTIVSDLDDYPPGGLVTLTGSNWQPGEVVHIFVNDDWGSSWNRHVDVTADESGIITDQFTLPDWFAAYYGVVATGPISGTATTSFTDANVNVSPTRFPASSFASIAAGSFLDFSAAATRAGNPNDPTPVATGLAAQSGNPGCGSGAATIPSTWPVTLVGQPVSVSTTATPVTFRVAVPTGTATGKYQGQFRLTFTAASQGASQDNLVFCIDVTAAANADPVANDDTATVAEDSVNNVIDVLVNDNDGPDSGETLTIVGASITDPPHGTAVLGTGANAGKILYTPDADYFGADAFSYTISDGNGGSDTATVNVTVTNVNDPPVLAPIADDTLPEMVLYEFDSSASDVDANTLTFSLIGAPTGASIDPATGEFSWTPSELQGPGAYTFTVRVTDNGSPALYDDDEITLTVLEVNRAPVLDPVADATIDEMVLYEFDADAADPDIPANTLTFSLIGAPTGASIDPATGEFSWTPSELQGPGAYTFTVRVTDNGSPALYDDDEITLTVLEVNRAPVLDPIGNKSGNEGSNISFDADAADPDIPANTLTFSLAAGTTDCGLVTSCAVPAGAAVDADSGAFSWTPPDDGTFRLKVVITDDGSPSLSDFEEITITVNNVKPTPSITSLTGNSGMACIAGNTVTLGFSWTDPAGTNDTYGYDVNWGDGNHTTVAAVPGVVSPITGLTHTYVAGGPYLISVTVNDSDPGVGTTTNASSSFSFLYTSTGIQQPINGTGPRSSFKIGSTIPVKLNIVDCSGNPVSGLTLTVGLMKLDNNADPANETIPASVPDVGSTMRANGTGAYIYNLSTKRSQLCSSLAPCTSGGDLTAGSYRLTITGPLISSIVASFDAKQ